VVDRDVIVQRAAAYGVSAEQLQEAMQKAPSFFERFLHKRYLYLALIQSALADEVCTGRVIYHGNAGHLLLKGGMPVLRVRIIAPLELRIEMAQQRLKIGRNEVINYIEEMDENRRKWTQFLYGVDWTDASLYDLVINLEYLDLEHACQIVTNAVKNQECFEHDEGCRERMKNYAIASRVKANLAIDDSTSDVEVEVECENGIVRISGKLSDVRRNSELERIALSVPGVVKVDTSNILTTTPD
jgi:hypothetical protein